MLNELGPMAEMQMQDPIFSSLLWKLTPASLAVRLTNGQFKTWNYTQLLSRKLVDVAMGRCPRLIVCMPPRHGKSYLVSQWFNVWHLENFPERKIILASYEADFAAKWGMRVRDTIQEHQDLLSVRFASRNPAQHAFDTTEGGSMTCAGVGGPLTGKGANILIIDDPVKNPCSIETPILFSNGSTKRLGDVQLGDLVVTHKGRGRRVLSIFERGECDCVKIKTFSGREVIAELTHPFLTLFDWKRAEELEIGNRLCLPKIYELSTETDRKLEDFRFAGYITGDGCCNTQVAMAVFDEEEKDDFEKCVLAIGCKSTRPGKSRDAGSLHVSGGVAWTKAAEMHGKLAGTKVVPPWVFTAPDEHIANFIGAYFATDGCVSSYDDYANGLIEGRAGGKFCTSGCKIQFDSISKELLEGVQLLLARLSIYARLNSSRVKYRGNWRPFWTLFVTSNSSMRRFTEVIPVHHSEKRVKLANWGAYLRENANKSNSSVDVLRDVLTGENISSISPNVIYNVLKGLTKGTNFDPVGREFIYDKIVSLEPCRAACRCIEVEEDSSFLANGLVAHNSEEANSRTMRDKAWDWWTSTARTRIEPFIQDGKKVQPSVVVMATRWNADDLIGRLINPEFSNDKGQKEDWEVFVFPACADPEVESHYTKFGVKVNQLRLGAVGGEAQVKRVKTIREVLAEANNPQWRDLIGRKKGEPLCPDRFNEVDLALFRGTSLRDWYSLYQQIPGDESDDGNVYHQFNEATHCKALQRQENMQLFVSMDFNVDPMTCVIGQYDKGLGFRMTERVEVLEEIILPNSNTQNMMFRLLQELAKYKYGYLLQIEVYGDAAGTQRSSQSQKTNWQIVSEHFALDRNIHYRFIRRKANPTIVDRVNAVNTMLRAADGSVRLYVDDMKCPELVNDFKKVRFQQDSSGTSTGLLDKSDKRRTHISDALGYCIEYVFSLKARGGARKGIVQ